MLRGVTNSLPFAKLLGIEIREASPEKVTAEMVVRDELCTRPAVLHGGAIMSLADTLGAVATMLNLSEGSGTTTIESKPNFLGTAPSGSTVVAECTPIHRGKRTMVWQTKISTRGGSFGCHRHADSARSLSTSDAAALCLPRGL